MLLLRLAAVRSGRVLSPAQAGHDARHAYDLEGFIRVGVEILEGLAKVDELRAVACV